MDETQTLRELLEIMHEHDLDAIKVRVGDAVYELVRREGGPAAVPGVPLAAANLPSAAGEHSASNRPANIKCVVAPLTGVFYLSSSPETEPFVDVGMRVESGSVLCILEAMKLFNEIQSDFAGVITRILPQNGELVSQGQELFWIEP